MLSEDVVDLVLAARDRHVLDEELCLDGVLLHGMVDWWHRLHTLSPEGGERPLTPNLAGATVGEAYQPSGRMSSLLWQRSLWVEPCRLG